MTPFLATVLLALLAPGEAVAAEGWRRPLGDGVVTKAFAYDRAAPFARGARRGIDVSAPSGARVGAVCAGTVVWAGRVPQWGRGVTLRCPRGLIATELGLASIAVRRGAVVLPGTTLGRLSVRGTLRVGARRAADRLGWIDPEPLFAAAGDARPLPLVPAILRRGDTPRVAPRAPRPAGGAEPLVAPRRSSTSAAHRSSASAPHRASHVASRTTPPPARPWPSATAPHPAPSPLPTLPVLLGLALVATATTGAPVARRRRRRRPIAEIAVAQR